MRFATGLATIVGNRVMAAPPVRAANRSTAARTLGTRNASWTNQVSRTSPRRDSSATRTGGCRGGGGCGAAGVPAGTQYSQSGGAGGQSGGALHPGGGAQPGGGSGHPGGGRHTKPGTPIRTSYEPAPGTPAESLTRPLPSGPPALQRVVVTDVVLVGGAGVGGGQGVGGRVLPGGVLPGDQVGLDLLQVRRQGGRWAGGRRDRHGHAGQCVI